MYRDGDYWAEKRAEHGGGGFVKLTFQCCIEIGDRLRLKTQSLVSQEVIGEVYRMLSRSR